MTSADRAGDAHTPTAETPFLELRERLPEVVDTPAALARAVRRAAAGAGPCAIDAERASGYRYSQRAYLVQLRRAGAGTTLIDPIPFGDVPNQALAAMADAVADAEWVIHAASQDLPCLADLGMRPTRLFDTELAGRLLNYPRVALGVLVEELVGYRMRKEHSAVDWSRRPLPEPWLLYAALDVEVLIELRDVLADRLERSGKSEWAAQEFEAWTRMAPAEPRREPWRRTSGIHRVRGRRGLAIVRAMWELRDAVARERDVSSTRIVADRAIVEAAAAAPASRSSLGKLPGFSTRGAQRYVKQFHAAIASALELPDVALPAVSAQVEGPPPARVWPAKFPAAATRLSRCREAVNALARLHDVPPENLLAPEAVRRLAWTPPAPSTAAAVGVALKAAGARPWQIHLTATTLAEALASE